MKKLLLITFICLSASAFSQNLTSWYKQIKGAIDKYPVTMHLHKAGHNYYGYYYYDTQQKPIYCNGDDTSVRGKVNLVAFSSSDATETFSFSIVNTNISGTWKKDEQSKPLMFSGKESAATIPLTFVYTQGEKKLRSGIPESPQATFFAGSIWPTGSSALDIYVQKIIRNLYAKNAGGTEIGKIMLRNKFAFFDEYENDFKDVKTAELKESSFMYNMDQSENILMVYQGAKFISIGDNTYVYSGGAHGNYGTGYSVFDLVNKKEIKLNDVLTAEGKRKVTALLAKALRTQFKLKPSDPLTEVLFENKIAPNQNFYLTGKGIGFSYNPYEIAAYAYGEINLFIPFTDIESGLQPFFKKLLQP
jgi:hypothetical protein